MFRGGKKTRNRDDRHAKIRLEDQSYRRTRIQGEDDVGNRRGRLRTCCVIDVRLADVISRSHSRRRRRRGVNRACVDRSRNADDTELVKRHDDDRFAFITSDKNAVLLLFAFFSPISPSRHNAAIARESLPPVFKVYHRYGHDRVTPGPMSRFLPRRDAVRSTEDITTARLPEVFLSGPGGLLPSLFTVSFSLRFFLISIVPLFR